jgi:anion-transporting  ArsA/GET3 family ATPase
MAGRRVLCLTIDPARRLANSLGLTEMQTDEQEVSPALFRQHGIEVTGTLHAMMLDTKRTFDQLVANHASGPEARDRILNNRLYQYVSGSLAGTQEYMAMEKLHEVRARDEWDLIVLDTPPSANALDFLDAPERLVGAIDSTAMRWFIQAFEGAGKFSFNVVGKSAGMLLRGLARFTGAAFLEQIAEFVAGLNDLFGGFRERAAEVSRALRSDDVAFVIVTRPASLAIEEAMHLSESLVEKGMRCEAYVLNCTPPATAGELGEGVDLLGELRSLAPTGIDPSGLLPKLRQAYRDERRVSQAAQVQAARLRAHVEPGSCYVEVPEFERDVHDLGALAEVARYLATA